MELKKRKVSLRHIEEKKNDTSQRTSSEAGELLPAVAAISVILHRSRRVETQEALLEHY